MSFIVDENLSMGRFLKRAEIFSRSLQQQIREQINIIIVFNSFDVK